MGRTYFCYSYIIVLTILFFEKGPQKGEEMG
jgi:hypothetical protein